MTMTIVRQPDGDHPGDEVTANAAGAYGTAKRVIVGVDDTESGRAAIRWAVAKASSDGAQLIAVRAWALGLPAHGGRRHRHQDRNPVVITFAGDSQREAATALVRRVFGRAVGGLPAGISTRIQVPEGDPAIVLTDLAVADGDLLVLGDEYGSRLKRIVHGSVSRYCSSHAHCPVVVVEPAGLERRTATSTEKHEPGPQSPDEPPDGPGQTQTRGAS